MYIILHKINTFSNEDEFRMIQLLCYSSSIECRRGHLTKVKLTKKLEG